MSDLITISTGLSNYYGSVEFVKQEDGKYYIELENYSKTNQVEISKEFYDAAVKEFSK